MSRRLLTWIGAIASVAATLYFVRAIAGHWQSLAPAVWDRHVLVASVASLVLYLATYAFATRAWQLDLRPFGARVGFTGLAHVLMLSQFAKYLPGNIGHHVGRVVLAKRVGLAPHVVVASMVLDTLLVVLAGLVCSLPAVALLPEVLRGHGAHIETAASVALLAGLLMVAAACLIPAARRKISLLARRFALPMAGGFLFHAWILHCLSFAVGASALYLLCQAMPDPVFPSALDSAWMQVVGIYAAAWLAGFLMPGAPAGLGIRELVLLLGLTPLYGEQQAATAAATLRLVTTLGDGLLFGFAVMQDRRSTRRTHA